jgi:hypothetical protein
MRPKTPLAVENGVGKLAAYTAPNVSMGKRAWRKKAFRSRWIIPGDWGKIGSGWLARFLWKRSLIGARREA